MAARAARDAARYAKSAADAANSSAVSDREANDLLRDNTALELRAYLSVEPSGITQLIGTDRAIGQVSVRNVGKLPAYNVGVTVYMKRSNTRGNRISCRD